MDDKNSQNKEPDEQQIRATINAKLVESGERERLKQMLQQKLIECGWRDQVKANCRELVKQKGLDAISVEELVNEMVPKSRALVPDPIKKELLQRIRNFLNENANLYN